MSSPEQPPTKDQIQSQLDRIFASETFVSSKRIRELLEYLVNESGREGRPRLKELAIGIAVFGRDETFDPRIDSVVRVEVGRLRSKLREYYAGVGVDDPVRIEVPKGAYVPTIGIAQKRNDSTMVPPTRRLWPKVVGIAFSILVLAAGIIFLTMQEGLSPASVSTEGTHTLAVLPLNDWTGNTDDYFSEAMTDVLIASLSGYPELRITSLSSVMNYKATHLQPSQIAEQLGVESIVDGTVFREADRVRITVNLIDAIENRNIWSETYNRSMTGVLALQEDVASEIARQLVGELVQGERPPEREINPIAYEAFLKGTYWRNRLTAEGFNRGLVFFQQAIDLQPDYAEAYAAMAACHCRLAGHRISPLRNRHGSRRRHWY